LNWGNSLNQRHRGGKWLTMVMMFVGGGCVGAQWIFYTILTVQNLRSRSFLFPSEPQ
jgi:hypothetical protein